MFKEHRATITSPNELAYTAEEKGELEVVRFAHQLTLPAP
jgi:hypothetical protein